MTRRLTVFALALLAAGTLAAAPARAGLSISILATAGTGNGNAKIYEVDVATGAAAFKVAAQDPGTTQNQYSPNGLGVSGTDYFYTTFDTDASGKNANETFYRNNTALLGLQAANDAIASGDAFGNTFYYVDRNGKFVTVNNISSNSPTSNAPTGQDIGTGANRYRGDVLGDVAVDADGKTAYLTYGTSLSKFRIDNLAAGFTTTLSNVSRFVGLGFDQAGGLHGVRRVGNDWYLFSVDKTTLVATQGQKITGLTPKWEVTDAARAAAVPGPSVLAMGIPGLLGLLGLRRKFRKAATA